MSDQESKSLFLKIFSDFKDETFTKMNKGRK